MGPEVHDVKARTASCSARHADAWRAWTLEGVEEAFGGEDAVKRNWEMVSKTAWGRGTLKLAWGVVWGNLEVWVEVVGDMGWGLQLVLVTGNHSIRRLSGIMGK